MSAVASLRVGSGLSKIEEPTEYNQSVGESPPPVDYDGVTHADMRAENLLVLDAHYHELVDNDPEKVAAIREYIGLEEDIDTLTMEELLANGRSDGCN